MINRDCVYLNGKFVSADQAAISPFDRGFLFAHAAYEVTGVYNRRLIDFDAHATRLQRTLAQLDILNPETGERWREIHEELIERNGLEEGLLYLQVSAGSYGNRDFSGPDTYRPTVFMFANRRALISDAARTGISVITLADQRWKRRDLKTTQLVSQALAYRSAHSHQAETAILHEDGFVTEAASANLWIVDREGELRTRDLSEAILAGVTRQRLLENMARQGSAVIEGRVSLDDLSAAREVFTSSSGALILPVTQIDGQPVGDGAVGPVTRAVQELYYAHIGVDTSALAWLAV